MNAKKSLTLFALLLSGGAHHLSAAIITWSAVANGNWATGSNWLGSTAPGTATTSGNGDTAVFNTATGVTVTQATRGLNTLNFDTAAGSFTFNSGNFFFQSGGSINLLPSMTSTGQVETINTPITAIGSLGISNNAPTSNVLNIKGNITNSKTTAGNAIITLSGSNTGANTVSGVISDGPTRITQVGLTGIGTWILSGSNTYTGGTAISAGTLVIGVSGTGSVTGGVSVGSGGTLAGSGNATGTVSIAANSFIAPGDNVSRTGTFTTTGALSLTSNATFLFDLNSTTTAADELIANGVTLGTSAVFTFTDLGNGSGVTNNEVFTLIDNTSGSAISGAFSNLLNGATFVSNGVTYTASYTGGVGGNDLILTATVVPEPATWSMMLGGLGLLAFGRRRLMKSCSRVS